MTAPGNPRKHHASEKMDKYPESYHGHSNGNKINGHEKSVASGPQHPEKTKNVSHVPCKFFRQSICQAGDKCPFSHDSDNDQQAVCKYFQKGNCKFGSKCALAHITPDGRQVNKRSKDIRRKDRKDDDTNHPELPLGNMNSSPHQNRLASFQTGDFHNTTSQSRKIPTSGSSHHPTGLISANSITTSSPAIPIRTLKSKKSGSSSSRHSDATAVESSSVEMASQILSKFNGTSPRTGTGCFHPTANGSRNGSSSQLTSSAATGNSFDGDIKGLNSMRSMSSNIPHSNRLLSDGYDMTLNNTWTELHPGMIEGSAIIDDDEDTLLEEQGSEDEDGYREQLVPSTSEDLLTPLERERRNSCNSQQYQQHQQQKSGRVLSSPSSTKAVRFMFRRGSEPMSNSSGSYFSQERSAAGGFGPGLIPATISPTLATPKTKNTGASDLWGPRNLDTPFMRSTGFSSPTQAPSSMETGSLFAASMKQSPYNYQNGGHLANASPPSSSLDNPTNSFYLANAQDLSVEQHQPSSRMSNLSFSSSASYPSQTTFNPKPQLSSSALPDLDPALSNCSPTRAEGSSYKPFSS